METKPDDGTASPSLEHTEEDLRANFGLSEDAARATAEDELGDSAPAPSSYEVELERIRRANGETK